MDLDEVEGVVIATASDICGMPSSMVLGSAYLCDIMEHEVFLDFVAALANRLGVDFGTSMYEVENIREVVAIAYAHVASPGEAESNIPT